MNQGPAVMGMILKGYPRISETFISNEIRLLEEQGIVVHIFSMRHPRESFTHKSVEAIEAYENVFFDVRSRLTHKDWIISQVFANAALNAPGGKNPYQAERP